MALPEPETGLVVRYAYLWWEESRAGKRDGRKDRPCAVVTAVRRSGNSTVVYVVPVTHTRPPEGSNAIEIPPLVKHRLGLDSEPSWIVTTEYNRLVWPGPDLRKVDARDAARGVVYGQLPKALTALMLETVKANVQGGKAKGVPRDE